MVKDIRSRFLGSAGASAWLFATPVGMRMPGRVQIALDPADRPNPGAAPDRLKALLSKRAGIRDQMGAIIAAAEAEDRDLTDEERERFDALKAEVAGLDTRIERLDEHAGALAALDAPRPAQAARPQLSDSRRHTRGPEARRDWENFGEFMHAVRFRPNDQRLNFVEGVGGALDENGEMRAELRMDDGAAGGFAIPPQFVPTLRELTPEDGDIIRSRAEVIPAGTPPDAPVTMPALDQTGAAPGNMFGGVQVQWIGEGATKPRTDLRLREITLTPHEVAGTMLITDKLLRNWPAASGLIERQLRAAMAQAEYFAFLTGNGVAKPRGILVSSATYKVARAQANKIAYMDLVNMLARVMGPNAVWVYSKSALPQLMALQNPSGQYIWAPSAVPGQPATLLGRPAIESNRNPVLGSAGDVWLADLKHYLIKDGSGPYVAASEHVYFESNKTVIKAFWNVDGAPWLTAPVALENGWLTSPFVLLDVPAP